jgi:hypothetical protein
MIPFGDYQLIKEVSERFPGSVEIVRGTVIFNEDWRQNLQNAAATGMDYASRGLGAASRGLNRLAGQTRPKPPVQPGMHQQIVTHGYNQQPGQIDTMNNPMFKQDVESLRGIVGKLQTPELQNMMKQWMQQNFTPIPGVGQDYATPTASAPAPGQPSAASAQNSQSVGAINQPAIGSWNTAQQPTGGQNSPDLSQLYQPIDTSTVDASKATTTGNDDVVDAEVIGDDGKPDPKVLPMNQQKLGNAAMWKSMWKH